MTTLELRQRLTHLPRDARDTLFQLFVIGWTIAPHLLHLPPWCGAMALALLAWRARLALHRRRPAQPLGRHRAADAGRGGDAVG